MIDPHDAYQIILQNTIPLPQSRIALSDAYGYTLAEDINADRDFPPTDRTAVDGFAVRSDDIRDCPCTLRLIGEVPAGKPATQPVVPGTCIRVLTGSGIPPQADSVVMVEETSEHDGQITFPNSAKPGGNIRKKGEEALAGDILVGAGTVLGPIQTGICASVGKAELTVFSKPRVLVICTGEELRRAGESVADHQIRDVNGPALKAALDGAGFPGSKHVLLSDNMELISREISRGTREADVILLTGGVSVGTYDYVPKALKEAGGVIHFHNVAVKPGKPFLYASIGAVHVFGLPGNPMSVLTGFYEFVLPALKRLAGVPLTRCKFINEVQLLRAVRSKKDRYHLIPAKVYWDYRVPGAEPLKTHGSADIIAAVKADGVVVVPPDEELPKGAFIEFHPWK
jgi:molybdopterin molybdotransferase